MKVILAIDSFKGSLTSEEAGEAVREGVLAVCPECQTEVIPIADGGEGALSVWMDAMQGKKYTLMVHDPCMNPVQASYGISTDGNTALIEMASASGLPLIKKEQRNPMKTTSYGTGELIRNALDRGCREFFIGIGGSATNDAGTGMLQALGFQFLDKDGRCLGQGGEILEKIVSVDASRKHPELADARFIVACDVKNPFCGSEGAAYVFARQKGADDKMIAQLDKGMYLFAEVIQKETGKNIVYEPGSGAAGGMGGGLMAFLNAELRSGADWLLSLCRFEERILGAELMITGEGRIDRQSLMGKIPGKVLQMGQMHHIPVIALAGCVEDEWLLIKAGFQSVYAAKPKAMSLEKAMERETAVKNLREAAIKAMLAYSGR